MLNVELSANVWNPRIWWVINVDHPFDHHFPTTHGEKPIGLTIGIPVYPIFRQNQLQNQQLHRIPNSWCYQVGPPWTILVIYHYISTTYLENLPGIYMSKANWHKLRHGVYSALKHQIDASDGFWIHDFDLSISQLSQKRKSKSAAVLWRLRFSKFEVRFTVYPTW